MEKRRHRLVFLIALLTFSSCGENFLNVRRDKSQVVPKTVEDYDALFNRTSTINNQSSHLLATVGGDEYYLTDEAWSTLPLIYEKNAYIWADDVYEQSNEIHDWNNAYHRILLANMALDGLKTVTPHNDAEREAWNKVKGTALFTRAFNYYQLAQVFCKPYDEQSASTDPGLPLRLESDVTVQVQRLSVDETYRHIIDDLTEAAELLPLRPDLVTQPSKVASFALLAKTYLQIADYSNALRYSNMCLENKPDLLDFNSIDVSAEAPFPYMPLYEVENPEIVYFATPTILAATGASRINMDTVLVDMYEEGDLRKEAFYMTDQAGKVVFKGSYSGAGPYGFFSGLSNNEQYLISAECYARRGMIVEALDVLNRLLINRYREGAFVPVSSDGIDLLKRIVTERRKELVLRGIAWEDFRRLGREPELRRTLTRIIDGVEYKLEPNTAKCVWPIPDSEVDIGGITQNER